MAKLPPLSTGWEGANRPYSSGSTESSLPLNDPVSKAVRQETSRGISAEPESREQRRERRERDRAQGEIPGKKRGLLGKLLGMEVGPKPRLTPITVALGEVSILAAVDTVDIGPERDPILSDPVTREVGSAGIRGFLADAKQFVGSKLPEALVDGGLGLAV